MTFGIRLSIRHMEFAHFLPMYSLQTSSGSFGSASQFEKFKRDKSRIPGYHQESSSRSRSIYNCRNLPPSGNQLIILAKIIRTQKKRNTLGEQTERSLQVC